MQFHTLLHRVLPHRVTVFISQGLQCTFSRFCLLLFKTNVMLAHIKVGNFRPKYYASRRGTRKVIAFKSFAPQNHQLCFQFLPTIIVTTQVMSKCRINKKCWGFCSLVHNIFILKLPSKVKLIISKPFEFSRLIKQNSKVAPHFVSASQFH